MASNSSSFQMDDQSDADFFDKLVAEDDDYQISKPGTVEENNHGIDGYSADIGDAQPQPEPDAPPTATAVDNASDALSKLILDETVDKTVVSEEASGLNESGGANENISISREDGSAEGFLSVQKKLSFDEMIKEEVATEFAETSSRHMVTEYGNNEEVGFSFNDIDDGNPKSLDSLDSNLEESSSKSGTKNICTNVKEVQWSNFNATSTEADLSGFGSYSDFYAVFPGSSTEQAGQSGEDFFSTLPLVENKPGLAGQQISDPTPYKISQVSENGTVHALGVALTQSQVKDISEAETYNGHMSDVQNQHDNGKSEGHFGGLVSADQSYSTEDGQDAYYNHSWENAYPGWRYDYATGQWHKVEEYETSAVGSPARDLGNREGSLQYNLQSTESNISYSSWQMQGSHVYHGQTDGASVDRVESLNTDATSDWAHGSTEVEAVQNGQQDSQTAPNNQQNVYYDPQYPGWYYDLVAQEWHQITEFGQTDNSQQTTHVTGVSDASIAGSQQMLHEHTKVENEVDNSVYMYNDASLYSQNNQFQGFQTQSSPTQWSGNIYDSKQASHGETLNNNVTGEKISDAPFGAKSTVYNPVANIEGQSDKASSFYIPNSTFAYNQVDRGFSSHYNDFSLQSSDSGQNAYSYGIQPMDQNKGSESSYGYYTNQHTAEFSQQMYQDRQHANYTPVLKSTTEGWSSEGRPPHALVTFGFGGKIVVFNPKNNINMQSSYGSQDNAGGVITVHSVGQLAMENSVGGNGDIENSYFNALCRQAFSSPLVGGSVASKEIFKWIDEKIANCESATSDFRNPEILRMLLCSLKIFCQHYGKLRSTFGGSGASQETDGPEAALTKLFASAKSTGYGVNEFGVVAKCLQSVPSESQLQSTALEMKNLLVAGKRKEALLLAQQGQLWGPALVLAWQLGEKFYVDTVKLMAQQQFLPGSPLRTLCLLLAGQSAEIFSPSNSALIHSHSGMNTVLQQSDQDCMSGMLNDWQENLAIIVANRTKGDERVIVHLGDCLWKERGEVAAAHTCYLVAEATFEYFSDSARLCLIGADHWKYPRTYASPEAIQRTELYEYAKLLGNPQYILLSFQPYKLIYAHMLAEVGKVSDSMKYCQAVQKILRNAGRASEVEACRQLASSLEDRIRIHTQGGYSSNLAPSKLVGRFLTTIDRSIHRIIGGPPPPSTSDSNSSLQNGDSGPYSSVPKVANTIPRAGATSLMPSASMEPISDWTGNNNKSTIQTRSVSEPNFIKTPQENQSSITHSKIESFPSKIQSNTSSSGGQSRFGRFGVQIFQKAVGLIAKSHNNEAKLGEKNKFYYDEKLKRWVEEGAAPPTEEPALSAPPTSATFISNSQTTESSYSIGSALHGQSPLSNGGSESRSSLSPEHVSGMPPVPPSMNQFSARGRLQGVRSRYVDTFNKSGGTAPSKSFQSPVIPAARSGGLPPTANFFIPTPVAFDSNSNEAAHISEEDSGAAGCTSTDDPNLSTDLHLESSGSEDGMRQGAASLHRFSSADNVRSMAFSSHSRAASWSGEYPNSFKIPGETEVLKTPDTNQFSKVSNVSGRVTGYFSSPTKLDAQKLGSGGYVYSSLPSPPPIVPSHSSPAIKALVADGGSTNRLYNQMDHVSQTGFQADGFGDLQEVEL